MGSLAVCGRRLASFHKSLAPSCTCSWSWGLLSVCAFRGLEETRVCVTCRSIQAGARFYEMREASLPLVHCVTVPKPTSQVLPCITCQFRAAGVCPLGGLLFHLYNHLCWHTQEQVVSQGWSLAGLCCGDSWLQDARASWNRLLIP